MMGVASQAPSERHTMNHGIYGQPQQPIIINNTTGKPKVRHGLHLLLTVLTLGAWAPVWLIVWAVTPK